MTSQQPPLPNANANVSAAPIAPHCSNAPNLHHALPLDSSPAPQPLPQRPPTDRRTGSDRLAHPAPSCSHTGSASSRRPAAGTLEPWPEEAADGSYGLYSLHRMFDIVGAQLTHRDVRVLSFLFVDVIDEYERGGIRSGRDFLLALERQGRCDETNFRHVLQLLRIITRHDLLPYVTLRKRQAGE